MSFKFPVYRYAMFFKGPKEMLAIDREHADRTEVSRSWQECARAYPDRHVILFSRLSKKEQCWFTKEEN